MIRSALLVLLAFHFSIAPAPEPTPLKAVEHVDLTRYAGKWYELARIPNRFENKCDRDVTAEYTLDGSTVRVSNTCIKTDGQPTTSTGTAKVEDAATNAKLKVTFFWPFYGKYWIIGLDPDYRWAVVGEPERKYLWVLSRTPTLAPKQTAEIDRIIADHAYQTSSLVWTKQTTTSIH